MVRRTRNNHSLRRSFRTRPSNQHPVIHVRHADIELFDDISGNDLFYKSTLLRKQPRKKTEQSKVIANENIPLSTNVDCKFDSAEIQLNDMNQEFEKAHNFSLYIENQDGVRMKAVGNKLVKYDEYYKTSLPDRVVPSQNASTEGSATHEQELQQQRKAVWSCARRVSEKQKWNAQSTIAEEEISLNKKLTTYTRNSIAAQEIEEVAESESVEALIQPISSLMYDREHTKRIPTISTPIHKTIVKGCSMASLGAHERNTDPSCEDSCGSTTRSQSLEYLSLSPIQTAQNIEVLDCTNTSIPDCLPQAQSTPFSEKCARKDSIGCIIKSASNEGLTVGLIDSDEKNVSHSQISEKTDISQGLFPTDGDMLREAMDEESTQLSFDTSRWRNVTERTKCRLLFMRSRNVSIPFNTPEILDDGRNILLTPAQPSTGKMKTEGLCETVLTLAEKTQLHHNPTERHIDTNMATSTTYRNVSCLLNDSIVDIPYYLNNYPDIGASSPLSQLLFVIGQTVVIDWKDLPKDVFCSPHKIGEGVYGEVFATAYNEQPVALKVIPFYGDEIFFKDKVNGEYLLDAAGILPEVLINRELSALSDLSENFSTPNFIQLLKVNVVKGHYPEEFLVAWDEFDAANGSENDRPSEYSSDQQLFVAMSMAMGGDDLEHFQMHNENQVISVLLQIAISLVVAEERLEFEHRDLHIGNVLVLKCDDDLRYRFAGGDMVLHSYGVKVHLIDFTLSRMSKEGTTVFRDLEEDEELFTGGGDYQFDIYRMMRNANQGDWMSFNPRSNCFWLHYLAVKLINQHHCKRAISKKRRRELRKKWDHLLEFDSVRELFNHDDFLVDLQHHVIIKQSLRQ